MAWPFSPLLGLRPMAEIQNPVEGANGFARVLALSLGPRYKPIGLVTRTCQRNPLVSLATTRSLSTIEHGPPQLSNSMSSMSAALVAFQAKRCFKVNRTCPGPHQTKIRNPLALRQSVVRIGSTIGPPTLEFKHILPRMHTTPGIHQAASSILSQTPPPPRTYHMEETFKMNTSSPKLARYPSMDVKILWLIAYPKVEIMWTLGLNIQATSFVWDW